MLEGAEHLTEYSLCFLQGDWLFQVLLSQVALRQVFHDKSERRSTNGVHTMNYVFLSEYQYENHSEEFKLTCE